MYTHAHIRSNFTYILDVGGRPTHGVVDKAIMNCIKGGDVKIF